MYADFISFSFYLKKKKHFLCLNDDDDKMFHKYFHI